MKLNKKKQMIMIVFELDSLLPSQLLAPFIYPMQEETKFRLNLGTKESSFLSDKKEKENEEVMRKQNVSVKYRKKSLFKVVSIHHHFHVLFFKASFIGGFVFQNNSNFKKNNKRLTLYFIGWKFLDRIKFP